MQPVDSFVCIVSDTIEVNATADTVQIGEFPLTIFGDTLEAPTPMFHLMHRFGTPLAYALNRDNVVMALVFVCFLIMVLLLTTSRQYLRTILHRFLLPSTSLAKQVKVHTPAETYTPLFLSLALCLSNGILLFAFLLSRYDVGVGVWRPEPILGVCIALFVAFYLLRWLLYVFTNWVFFRKSDIRMWNSGFSFILTVESVSFMLVTLCCINTACDIDLCFKLVIGTYALTRIFLFYHSFRIFFGKTYGVLHLIAYLCTLEMIPLLGFWKILQVFSAYLIVK